MATRTLNVSMPKELRDLVVREVAEGAYGSVSEYVREAVRAAMRRRRMEVLEQKLLEGLQGEPIEMNARFWKDLRRDVHRNLSRRKR